MTLIECIPNFSEGRRPEVIERDRGAAVRSVEGVSLLDVQSDPTHNRCVVTFVGHEGPIAEAAFRAIKKASELIDLNQHEGAHPRFGATDVRALRAAARRGHAGLRRDGAAARQARRR